MSEPRQIAVVHDYPGLLAALRTRAERLNVSRATIDDVSGLASGYAAKLLANPPMKTLGAVSLGPMLGALGVSLVLIEDPDQMRRIATRMAARNTSQVRAVHPTGSMRSKVKLITRRNARKMNVLRSAKVPRWRRIQIAKRAARARWKRARAKSARDTRAAPQQDQSHHGAPNA